MGNICNSPEPAVVVPKTIQKHKDKLPTKAFSIPSKQMNESSLEGLFNKKDGEVNDRRNYVDLKQDSSRVTSYSSVVFIEGNSGDDTFCGTG